MSSTTDAGRRRLRTYLQERTADGETYLKSKFVADDIGLSTREIGQLLADLRENDEEFVVERWAYSNATTWRVARA